MKRKSKIIITKIQRTSILNKTMENIIFCSACNEKVETLLLNQGNEMLQIKNEDFDWLIESKKVHLILMANGDLQICQKSI